MNENPQIPSPPPSVPRGSLWASLCVPPVATVVGNMAVGMLSKQNGGDLILAVPVMVAALILGFSFVFLHAITARYRGASVFFLYIAYWMGQAVICLAVFFGSCLLFLS